VDQAAAATTAAQRAPGGAKGASGTATAAKGSSGQIGNVGTGGDTSGELPLPGLQDLRGAWRGTVEMRGGGPEHAKSLSLDSLTQGHLVDSRPESESNPARVRAVDFDVQGNGWQWGPYQVQSVQAQGNIDAVEAGLDT
jgi:hypothetical protein